MYSQWIQVLRRLGQYKKDDNDMVTIILILVLATALTTVWLILLGRVNREDWITAVYNKIFENFRAIDKLRLKEKENNRKISRYSGIAAVDARFFLGGNSGKKIEKLERSSRELQNGNLKSINLFVMPGYALQREFEAIGKGGVHKKIMEYCYELYGKKNAAHITKHLLAKLLSYPIICIAATIILGVFLLIMGSATTGKAILGIGTIIVIVLTYTIYDELGDLVKKRRNAISRQFPNVVSKLALLVTSGMIMDRAWKETAYSQETELYREMRKTSEEIDNLISPEAAYSDFISRCNTKETTKLASAIMQNKSKGNAEIGVLLKNMAREAWQERRHKAKRDAEKANSKLMIPTMLLFLAILIMLMVPIAMNFSKV
jgi:tight adherence protein C